jgi:hypothetical protein
MKTKTIDKSSTFLKNKIAFLRPTYRLRDYGGGGKEVPWMGESSMMLGKFPSIFPVMFGTLSLCILISLFVIFILYKSPGNLVRMQILIQQVSAGA